MPSFLAAPIIAIRSLASKARESALNVRLGLLLTLLGAAAVTLTACDSTPQPSELNADTDREALVALYNATDGLNWTKNDKWLSDAPIGEWYGVTTDSSGRAISLSLYNNRLSGSIPPELGSLLNLELLYLNDNRLSGEIPSELGSLSKLQRLAIPRNELSGEIPPEMGSLDELGWLDLSDNRLSGQIPLELANLESRYFLNGLYLGGNQFSGCIPMFFGVKYTDIVDLGLLFCGARGTTPATDRATLISLYHATGGDKWHVNYGWLSDAPIREWHGVATNSAGRVIGLDFIANSLAGEIPTGLSNLVYLKYLALHGNELIGEIPRELGNLPHLESLRLSRNRLTGQIPPELGNLSNLEHLYLFENQLEGELPMELGNLSSLETLLLSKNRLSGCIPEELRDVRDNDFSELGFTSC